MQEEAKLYWSDPDTVLKAAILPCAVLKCPTTDSKGASSVFDFLKRFPVFSRDVNADVPASACSLVCIISTETEDIYDDTLPRINRGPVTIREAYRKNRLTICQLPWTCNYYFARQHNYEPGQLSNQLRREDHEDEVERYNKAAATVDDKGVPLQQVRDCGKLVPRNNQLEEQQDRAQAEILALTKLPADVVRAASKAKRILELKPSGGGNNWYVSSYLAEPAKSPETEYSWFSRQLTMLVRHTSFC